MTFRDNYHADIFDFQCTQIFLRRHLGSVLHAHDIVGAFPNEFSSFIVWHQRRPEIRFEFDKKNVGGNLIEKRETEKVREAWERVALLPSRDESVILETEKMSYLLLT